MVGTLQTVETLADGYGLVEGPRGLVDDSVLFSDVTGGGVFRWTEGELVETVLPKRRGIGGLVPHGEGGIVVAGRDLSHVTADGETRVLLAPDGATGINDIHTDVDGSVLLGVLRYRPMANEDVVPGEVRRLRPDGSDEVVLDGVAWPNGIGVSPDSGTLYVSDFFGSQVYAVARDGSDRRVLAPSPRGSCDGLAVAIDGTVWVALGPGAGVARLAPDGELLEILDVPGAFVSSVAFHGEHLLISTIGALLRMEAPVAGVPTPLARV
jgi:sugar lactone lactonase YvrE